MMLLALLIQAAQPRPPAPAATPTTPPEIQLDISATARRVVVDSRGQTSLTVHASVNGTEGEGNLVQVEAPELPQGRRELRNVNVRVRAEARLPEAENVPQPQEPQPQG